MKNSRLGGLGAILASGMLAAMGSGTRNVPATNYNYPGYPKEGKARPENYPAGTKNRDRAIDGRVGLGMHSGGKKMAGEGTGNSPTFSPKRDIGKGPEFTRSVRGISKGYINQHIRRTQQEFAARAARGRYFADIYAKHA